MDNSFEDIRHVKDVSRRRLLLRGRFFSQVDGSDDVTEESVGSSISLDLGRSVRSLDERLGPRDVPICASVGSRLRDRCAVEPIEHDFYRECDWVNFH